MDLHLISTILDLVKFIPWKRIFQQSPATGRLVDDIIRLRQRLEYIGRLIQTRNQEVKNEYNQALTKVLDAEMSLSHFAEVFNNGK
jgi:hypothetical protein